MSSPNGPLLVAGAGNAALCGAISAKEAGSSIAMLEAAPEAAMGGNSRFTFAGFRFASASAEDVFTLFATLTDAEREMIRRNPYCRQQFYGHLMQFSHNQADPDLARMLCDRSYDTVRWLKSHGVEWGLQIDGIKPEPMWAAAPGSVYAKGRGRGLVSTLLQRATEICIPIRYGHRLKRILLDSTARVCGVIVDTPAGEAELPCGALVLACGGFEASREMRRAHMGEAWARMKVRGTMFNEGRGICAALDIGAARSGEWSNGHAVPIAADSPDFGSLELGETTRRCLFQDGISVNRSGRRFMDEGEDRKWFMYSTTGVAVASQDGGSAYQVFDARILATNFEKEFYLLGLHAVDDTLEGLAAQLDVDGAQFLTEVERYNRAVVDDTRFNRSVLDGSSTEGITPCRSNFAARLRRPPFFAFKVVGGITFTYGGLKIDTHCRVLDHNGHPIPGLFAAGEASGGFFAGSYPANSGLTRGAVTGLTASRSALDYLTNGE